jgi:hypothetical protein
VGRSMSGSFSQRVRPPRPLPRVRYLRKGTGTIEDIQNSITARRVQQASDSGEFWGTQNLTSAMRLQQHTLLFAQRGPKECHVGRFRQETADGLDSSPGEVIHSRISREDGRETEETETDSKARRRRKQASRKRLATSRHPAEPSLARPGRFG